MSVYPCRSISSCAPAIRAASVGWTATSGAPCRAAPATLTSDALSGTTTTAGTPSTAAAYATARPWFPLECVTTPRSRCSAGNALIAAKAPRSLKDPVGCRDSGLTSRRGVVCGNGTSGVRTITPSRRPAAARVSSTVTSDVTGHPAAGRGVSYAPVAGLTLAQPSSSRPDPDAAGLEARITRSAHRFLRSRAAALQPSPVTGIASKPDRWYRDYQRGTG